MDLKEKQISSKNVFKGGLLNVYKDEVLCPNGNTSEREYIKHVGAACVVPFLPNGKVLVERQFRYPLGKVIYEFPAGKRDLMESPLDTAKRELQEETGYVVESIEFLGEIYPACAYSNEVIYLYRAEVKEKTETHLDKDENLELMEMSLEDFKSLVRDNQINDAKTLCVLTHLLLR